MAKKILVLTGISVLLIACGGSGSDDHKVTFEDFTNTVKSQVGDTAIDCGTLPWGESQLEANTCMAESFNNDQQFYAFFEILSYDSTRYGSPVLTQSGELKIYYFDSGTISSGSISNRTCLNAEFSGNVDTSWEVVFLCDE
ncbi:hypothetical protein P886_0263 [Alteromonadaceae bacterium 2753L.S.0a.02]|nr:hypothetical protein P886_0263 [Alteromonadaceae bacterium 2753L.S.0a.02]